MVILRSFSDGKLLLADDTRYRTANPINIGTILRPESPDFPEKFVSYQTPSRPYKPLSSKNGKEEKRVTIIGKKLNTLPTPLKNTINN